MQYFLLAFLAGVLTIFAPCVFTLLPIILAGSLQGTKLKKPVVIIVSLGISIFVFTLILKVSTALIYVAPNFWNFLSGGLILLIGIFTLFPDFWGRITSKLKLQSGSNKLLNRAAASSNTVSEILTGAALGPIFSSCSPTYALILATILPQNFALGVVNLLIYVIGMSVTLFLIALFGQRLVKKLKWAVNPKGLFKKALGILFIIIGLMIITGIDKQIETYLLTNNIFDATRFEINLLSPNNSQTSSQNTNFNSSNIPTLNVNVPYPAPEFSQIENWLNSAPLKMSELRGKVVLVDFWTYSCINCIRTLPYLKTWYDKYKDQGLVIVGVHSPEFSFEKLKDNVAKFANDNDLKYPIAQDNSYGTWNAFNNQYWPAEYLIDKNGNIVNTHFGEGNYDETEKIIQYLLGISNVPTVANSEVPITRDQSPETYIGYSRSENFKNYSEFQADQTINYTDQGSLLSNTWELTGRWNIGSETATSEDNNVTLKYNFSAKEVYLVMGSDTASKILVKLNGVVVDATNKGDDVGSDGYLDVKDSKLYRLIKLPAFTSNQILELTFPAGVKINAFTFGS